ncbi:monovalent cation/H(+) antiporter subunit G [Pseudanabaena sp. FACHB-1277]|jgi:multicomponent Na+:H+ antiporter subunit G|uniref:Monovalent cation/H(+) antiporter subunit G n=1 Tax=Pseudanabaena cinerea FACHB-1277 TaxID=2949581 RepID=A0A926UXP3_9CYAN|nr:monovalent cation/H(+) antiporter subunit G [Pseudanabaena cinerea]MBD2152035.1 monovalent cation/H(+) antiporter subunit G [Pseudanabaena cinerea FACHB-1277]
MTDFAHILSYLCIFSGIFFWFWGTSALVTRRSVLFKLHSLSVSDTLGSIAIIFGLVLLRPKELPLLILAIISLALWNTMLCYVLAYCSSSTTRKR